MADIVYKTTFSQKEIEQNKQKYLEARATLVGYLREIADALESAGEAPISGETRKTIMRKFDMVDHQLLHDFDRRSFEYFESSESPSGE